MTASATAKREYFCAACGRKLKRSDLEAGRVIFSPHTRQRYCPARDDAACHRAARKRAKSSAPAGANHERPPKAATEGGAVTDTATAEQKQEEAPPSVDELRAAMAKNQKGYDAYCELRAEMKGLSEAKQKPLKEKQAKHQKAFKAWKKAYNGLLKQGVSLRQLRAEAKAAEAPEPEAEPAAEAS